MHLYVCRNSRGTPLASGTKVELKDGRSYKELAATYKRERKFKCKLVDKDNAINEAAGVWIFRQSRLEMSIKQRPVSRSTKMQHIAVVNCDTLRGGEDGSW